MIFTFIERTEFNPFESRVVCPNFGHRVLTSSFTKYTFLQVKNSLAIIVNELSILTLFQLLNGDLLFSQHAYSIYKVHEPRMTKFRQVVEVKAHFYLHRRNLIQKYFLSLYPKSNTSARFHQRFAFRGKRQDLLLSDWYVVNYLNSNTVLCSSCRIYRVMQS